MLLDFLFPKTSLRGSEGEWMSPEEISCLRFTSRIFPGEELRKRGVLSIDRIFAMGSYRDTPLLKKVIHTFKYRRIPRLSILLTEELNRALVEYFPLDQEKVLCPVPLHFLRKFERGFNQAELLAAHLSKKWKMEVAPLLRRVRPTGHQVRRTRAERWKALRGAFEGKRGFPVPQRVILVDDVFTTGATLEECARVLKALGVQKVEAIVLAYD
ncbi:MAG TPA: ComF family protein [Candidatus Peribacterales bacterium]|nr:ComF family protein [Candidatus Peribacterales bacterium]